MSADDTKLVERCLKPGCGAQKIVGRPCFDWDCPQQTLTAAEHASALEASEAKNAALAAENATLKEAVAPFAAFANYLGRAPDDLVITRGSWIAAQQVTAGDFRRARAALRQEAGR